MLSLPIASAQTTAPAPNWEAIRKAALSPIDRQAVKKWVDSQLEQVFTATDPTKPGQDFYRTVITPVKAQGTAPPFIEDMARIISESFTARYQQAAAGNNRPAPLAPVLVLMTLREVGPSAAAMPAFRAVFTDPSPASRCQGLAGLNAIRASIPPNARATLIQDLEKLAVAESNAIALGRAYDIIKFFGDQDLSSSAPVLTRVLDARLTRIEKEGTWPAVADAEAAAWLAGKFRNLNPQAQTAAVRMCGRLLADAAYVVGRKPPQHVKTDMERIVLIVEERLGEIYRAKVPSATSPTPSVGDAVASTAADASTRIAAAVTRWIGSGQTKGALNDAFNLPAGLGIQRPAPTTATAPTS